MMEPSGFRLLLPGHPEHGAPAIEGMPDAITFDGSGWAAWSGAERMSTLP